MTYSVFCLRPDQPPVKIASGLLLADAQTICKDPDTSSRTTKSWKLLKRYGEGPWFYGYEKE